MKKWGIVISFLLIFAILGTAYFLLTRPQTPESQPEATEKPSVPVLSYAPEEVLQIDIQRKDENLSFVRGEKTWHVKNKPDIEILAVRVESLCVSAATLSADSLIAGDAMDLQTYGLKTPQAKVVLTFMNGKTQTILLGDPSPTNNGYYVCLDGERAVYLLSAGTANQFLSPLTDYRILTVTALGSDDIREISITKSGKTFTLSYTDKEEGDTLSSAWRIKNPVNKNADDALVQEKILTPVCNLTALDVVADSAENLRQYGFNGDKVVIRTANETIRLSVGKAEGKDYVTLEGKPTVYLMAKSALSFMDVTSFDVLERMTNLVSIESVESIDINLPGISATMEVQFSGEEMKYFVDGKPAEEEAFKQMYVELIALEVDGEVTVPLEESGRKPEATIVFALAEGSTTTLAYYPYDEFNYAVYENGECTFYIKKTKLTALGEKLRAFVQNANG